MACICVEWMIICGGMSGMDVCLKWMSICVEMSDMDVCGVDENMWRNE